MFGSLCVDNSLVREIIHRDSQSQAEVAEQHRELEGLRSKVEELNRRKRELEKRLTHLPTDTLKAKLLENVKVGGKCTNSVRAF